MAERERAGWPRALTRKLRRSDGQAILEFVLVLPLVVTLVFVLVQMGITFNNYIQVTDAARVAARAAAVYRFNNEPDACTAAKAAVSNVNASLGFVCTYPDGSSNPGERVSITVTDPWSINLPLLPISDKGTLTSTAIEALE